MKDKSQIKEKVLRVRVTAHQSEKLKTYAQNHGVAESYVIQQYIDRLPNPRKEEVFIAPEL
jgi:hypothetical protein